MTSDSGGVPLSLDDNTNRRFHSIERLYDNYQNGFEPGGVALRAQRRRTARVRALQDLRWTSEEAGRQWRLDWIDEVVMALRGGESTGVTAEERIELLDLVDEAFIAGESAQPTFERLKAAYQRAREAVDEADDTDVFTTMSQQPIQPDLTQFALPTVQVTTTVDTAEATVAAISDTTTLVPEAVLFPGGVSNVSANQLGKVDVAQFAVDGSFVVVLASDEQGDPLLNFTDGSSSMATVAVLAQYIGQLRAEQGSVPVRIITVSKNQSELAASRFEEITGAAIAAAMTASVLGGQLGEVIERHSGPVGRPSFVSSRADLPGGTNVTMPQSAGWRWRSCSPRRAVHCRR